MDDLEPRQKADLFALARRSRVRWVMETSKEDVDCPVVSPSTSEQTASKISIPGKASIQSVLDFFNELCDEDPLDVETFISQIHDDEDGNNDDGVVSLDVDEKISSFGGMTVDTLLYSHNDVSPFVIFLHRLRKQSPEAVAAVRSLQHFVIQIASDLRSNSVPGSTLHSKLGTNSRSVSLHLPQSSNTNTLRSTKELGGAAISGPMTAASTLATITEGRVLGKCCWFNWA